MSEATPEYAARVEAEQRQYAQNEHVHDLPPICFYWLKRYILPQLASFGYAGADEFFLLNLEKAYDQSQRPKRRFLSIGAGNCDTEVRLASALRAAGRSDFVIDCLDLNEQMIERGVALAAASGLEGSICPLVADFNAWKPSDEYDGVIANQALHHVVELEDLFGGIETALTNQGLLIVSDMIGRNGHRRWPEALSLVQKFWDELPESYRYNRQLRQLDHEYLDWDCSVEGFEGIRSQDILPLLVERFHFEFFYAFSNVTDPFIDRSYGPNFNAEAAWDRDFIDRVHACDEAGIRHGTLTPTHMLAVLTKDRSARLRCLDHLTPEFCIRQPGC
jgi:SAM-dependent methyltransferase